MIKKYILAIGISLLPGTDILAQEEDDPIERMNNIKLEGKYYTGEATAPTAQTAEEMAKMMLTTRLEERNATHLLPFMKRIEIKRGDMTMMFVYVAKDAAKGADKPVAPRKTEKTPPQKTEAIPPVNTETYVPKGEKAVSVIDQLLQAQTYTAAETILRQAQQECPTLKYGKPANMSDTDDCYLIMVDQEWNVAGIISPKTADGRKDMKTQQVVTSKDYPKCAVICVKLK